MKRPLFSALYLLTLMSAGLTIHQAFAQRSPSVEPMTEVSIEDEKPMVDHKGFDFTAQHTPKVAPETKRVPANIATKSSTPSTPYSYIGPLIFLFALPVALWIVVSKKMKSADAPEKVGYYPKTFQFNPYKGDTPKAEMMDDEDEDLPRAS